jgi:hypothetical protein
MNQIIKFAPHQFQGIAGRSNVEHRMKKQTSNTEHLSPISVSSSLPLQHPVRLADSIFILPLGSYVCFVSFSQIQCSMFDVPFSCLPGYSKLAMKAIPIE